ncbi:unnamed protein product [Lymnaea stagnalis]|uniref:Uncharacterized protein n=1 Tax=Lymnaea stagnalis TaxID=6523 RepID=A0AAV2HHU0_LYMST
MEKLEISAEVHFAQKLASNEKKIRDRAIKRLQKYLSVRSAHGAGLSDSDLLKIWKGLFYCMWMQDKPLIQEELSQRITNLIHCFPKLRDSLNFVRVFFETNAREWNGIDRLRLDKFMMMVRDMLHQTFTLLCKEDWPEPECCTLSRLLNQHVLQYNKSQLPDGLKIHLADIFVEELDKVSLEQMTSKKMIILLRPFIFFILNSNKMELVTRIMSDVVYRAVNTFTSGKRTPPLWEQKFYKKKKRNSADAEPVKMSEADAEEKMEIEEGVNSNSFSLDRSYLLLLLFRQAEKATTRAPNRALLYKFVKKYPKDLDVTTKFLNHQTSTNLNTEEAEGIVQNATYFEGYDLTLLEDDGKATDKQEKKKKKRKNKKQLDRELISDVNTVTSNVILNGGCDNLGVKKKSKKNKSESLLGSSETNLIKPQTDVRISAETLQFSCDTSKKRKRKKRVHDKIKNETVVAVKINDNEESSQVVACEKKVKKRKRVLLENDDSPKVAKKRKKVSTDSWEDTSVVSSNVLEESVSLTSPSSEPEDNNSNARSRSRSKSPPKLVPLSEAIELVTYSPKRMVTSPRSTSASPKSRRSPKRQANGSPPRSKPSTETPIMDKASAFVGDLCTALTGPCNIVKKALGMVSTNSDPGPGMKQKAHSIPGVVMTPGTKKKVVFDLRRNRANKFQDYIKSLAKLPDAPYEPSKSPSFSILKSPNVSLCIDDNSDSETKSESDISELSQASKSKRVHFSRRNSSGRDSSLREMWKL